MDKQNYTLRELEMQVLKENCSLLKSELIYTLEGRILKEPLKNSGNRGSRREKEKKPAEIGRFPAYWKDDSCIFGVLSWKRAQELPVMPPAVFARPSPGCTGLRRQTWHTVDFRSSSTHGIEPSCIQIGI